MTQSHELNTSAVRLLGVTLSREYREVVTPGAADSGKLRFVAMRFAAFIALLFSLIDYRIE